ncbi:hypothetical protein CEP51_004013 [Fusarium floridanum]|uniref:Heterokaryon incompatibility domain-containing protein n=1 Tax=Fusarium floridanum TaxID=1325733 RepID=A0A428S3C3_9HYPO|nr:hypothetical protein CEP51_004013 [Fusarium floridanum]
MPHGLDVLLAWSAEPGGRYAFSVTAAGSGVWIGFGAPEPAHDNIQATGIEIGRCLLKPTTEPLMDIPRILRWILQCEHGHGDLCQLSPHSTFAHAFRGMSFLRLIDVQNNCLVEINHFTKYVALSYVWGVVDNFRLTKANRPALLKPGSLDKVFRVLPETVADAITLVRRLGSQYLWVDALCLMQNDTDDLDRGVNAMDLIYERAWLTIVAACGHDANTRLPGVRLGTRMGASNTVEVKPGLTMGVVIGLDALLERSVYGSRGWTFQERLLSRRSICFIGDKLFYRCRGVEQAEHLVDVPYWNRPRRLKSHDNPPEAILMKNPVYDYSSILYSFTKRAFTNENDAPRAMAGIIARFGETIECQFLEGLPTAAFDLFLTFTAWKGSLRRRPALPSYSWTGWSGRIWPSSAQLRGESENALLRDHTWIIWYKRSASGDISLVWNPCDPHFPSRDMKAVGYYERRPFSYGRFIPTQLDTSRTTPTATISFSQSIPPYFILQFWTMSAFYGICDIDVFNATGYLVDRNGAKCGSIQLDGFEETTFFESQICFEVILLSESGYTFESHLRGCSTTVYPAVTEGWDCFYLLLLEWKGGLAQRRGSGKLIMDALRNSLAPGPVWKEILLA